MHSSCQEGAIAHSLSYILRRPSKILLIGIVVLLFWTITIYRNGSITTLPSLPLASQISEESEEIVVHPWSTVPDPPSPPFVLESLGQPAKPAKNALNGAHNLVRAFNTPLFRPDPSCASVSALQARYPSLAHTSRAQHSNATIYLALNLINAEAIIPNFIYEISTMLSLMGGHRFYFSIWENGSEDHTAALLVMLEQALKALGVRYKIVVKGTSQRPNKEGGRRILELAHVRNAALDELYTGEAATKMGIAKFDMVLFMNDIIWCAADMLEIIEEHLTQSASMTCATDWGNRVVYDRWVARTMAGLYVASIACHSFQ
ncbi:glycosyltransferase family 69 protein [Sphaerobolus stellatus SS14]|uniref:Unplaced genomic scaffold SPHSTscaffold_103, whole genome shotgun sequence n=1 Tax=Sphaerobolus stellatus (strain SS14) TaxID=990650 RepID=A0A0C9UNR0_SPHS4|nr:glycosyltransferase family 69 protein [Sphaerobolus stellatus SS14]